MKPQLPKLLLLAVLAATASADVVRERTQVDGEYVLGNKKYTLLQNVVTTVSPSADTTKPVCDSTTNRLTELNGTVTTETTDTACCGYADYQGDYRICGVDSSWFLNEGYVTNNVTLNVVGTNKDQIYFLYGRNGSDGLVIGNVEINVKGESNIGYLVGGSQTTSIGGGTTPEFETGNISITLSDDAKVGQIRGGSNGVEGGASGILKGNITITVKDNAQITGIVDCKKEVSKGLNAIRGCGGSGYSVDGKVTINVQDNAKIVGDIYAGARNWRKKDEGIVADVCETEINITGGTIKGDVYGGGSFDNDAMTRVTGNTQITIDGGKVEGNVYGGGKGCVVEGTSTIYLLSGDVSGTVYGGGADGEKSDGSIAESVIDKGSTLYIGDKTKGYTGHVGGYADFNEVIISENSAFTMTKGNAFASKEISFTLSDKNLSEAQITVGAGGRAAVDAPITLNVQFAGAGASGRYILVDASAGDVDLSNWNPENVEVSGVAGFNDLLWEGNTLVYYYAAVAPQVAIASNWGVFKSSQAFTGTLWGNRSNVIEIPQGRTVTDEKGISTTIAPTGKTLAWATVYGQSGRISGVGADYNLYGAAMGVEHQFANGSSVGAAMGYDWGKVSPFTQSAVDQETLHAALYGRAWAKQLDAKNAVALDWSVAYGQTESSHDNVAEDWSQDSWQFDVRATYSRALTERLTASGFVGVQYYTHDSDTADGLEMSSMHNLRVSVGAGLNYAATEKTNVYGELSVYRDAMRHNPYVAIGGKRYHGTNPGRTGVNVGVGAQHAISEQWSVRGGYNFQAAEDSTEHNVNVGAVYSF